MCSLFSAAFSQNPLADIRRAVLESDTKQLFKNHYYSLDTDEKQIIVRKLAEVMESRVKEGDATDCSRLAWLYLNSHEKGRAKHFTELGLRIEPDNEYCQKLAEERSI